MSTNDSSRRDGDRSLGFTLPARNVRGRAVRLDASVDAILAAHAYPEPIAKLLAEALVLTAMLGALLRDEGGQLTLQARGEGGPCSLLVADYREGELRGYAALDLDRRFPAADSETLAGFFGKGYLAITLDQTASAERYQGIVELGDTTLEAAAGNYFAQSEQLPTIIRLAAVRKADGHWTAGGLLVQQLSRKELGAARLHVEASEQHAADQQHVAALVGTLSDTELTDVELPLENLLWRLFHEEEVHAFPPELLSRGCRCSVEHITRVLKQFSEEERVEMRNGDGLVAVDCEFCARQFLLDV
ncbi:MAG: Hsp33 family molecular chaperone HslO [Sphingomonadaceae bacterium]